MPSLKDLKGRIKSVKSTQKITKAMKMVAASKLRRAREAAEASQPYSRAMNAMLARLAQSAAGNPNAPELMIGTGRDKTHLLIVVTGDRGLSGAFNGSIVRAARAKARALISEGKQVRIYALGKKANDLLAFEFRGMIVGAVTEVNKNMTYAKAESAGTEIFEIIQREQVDVVTLVFNHFKSVISQVVTYQQLMPLAVPAEAEAASEAQYEFEPSEEAILADLLPRNFTMQIFNALLESNAGFYGAQMNAMENATKNAGEMIKKLTLKYNRTRQANITKELIEIISGAEAI
jgi:F-type H+-transporting ATPase subunit gamma